MKLGHLLTHSGLTYPEASSKIYHDSLCQLGSSVSLPWVIYFEAFYLHVVSSFSCIPIIFQKFVLFLALCNLCICFVICPSVSCCSSHIFHLCCCYSSGVELFNYNRTGTRKLKSNVSYHTDKPILIIFASLCCRYL